MESNNYALDTETASGAPAERDKPVIEVFRGGIEPSFWSKRKWFGEDCLVEVDERMAHTNNGLHNCDVNT